MWRGNDRAKENRKLTDDEILLVLIHSVSERRNSLLGTNCTMSKVAEESEFKKKSSEKPTVRDDFAITDPVIVTDTSALLSLLWLLCFFCQMNTWGKTCEILLLALRFIIAAEGFLYIVLFSSSPLNHFCCAGSPTLCIVIPFCCGVALRPLSYCFRKHQWDESSSRNSWNAHNYFFAMIAKVFGSCRHTNTNRKRSDRWVSRG